jgi:enoyl-[acyl-carrier-protein] reductase (NADH)
MTRENLGTSQIERVIDETPLKRLVKLNEVVSLVSTLALGNLSGVTGQDFVIDGGWSISKLV